MTKELARACRIFCGYNTNLRIKLPTNSNNPTCYELTIAKLLEEHLTGVYGVSIYDRLGTVHNPQAGVDVDDYMKVLNFVYAEARDACRCVFE